MNLPAQVEQNKQGYSSSISTHNIYDSIDVQQLLQRQLGIERKLEKTCLPNDKSAWCRNDSVCQRRRECEIRVTLI